ncbi:hypothetical protein [Algoriphagus halophilus]|nr:hypothetical protein [Algoriphagus halophilus]
MKNIYNQFILPFVTISEDRWKFISWLILLVTFGLLGIWMPLIDNLFVNECRKIPFNNIILSGSLSTFSIVILVEGLSNLFNVKPKGKSKLSKGLKSITFGFTILIFTINVYLYGKSLDINSIDTPKLLVYSIILFGVISIGLATYLFCFRETNWELSADEYVNRQNSEIEESSDSDDDNPLPTDN